MNPQSIGVLSLRSLALLANLQGQTKLAQSLTLMADAAVAGINVDAHMQTVAANLAAGIEPDSEDLKNRIQQASADLQS